MSQTRFRVHARVSPTPCEMTTPEGAISGRLYIECGGEYFPAEEWYDVLLPVLEWWLENATRLSLPDSEVKCRFMDGPYHFHVRRNAGSETVIVTFHRNGRAISEQYTVDYRRFLATMRGSAKSVLNELRALGLIGWREASNLEIRLQHLLRLESEMKAHGLR